MEKHVEPGRIFIPLVAVILAGPLFDPLLEAGLHHVPVLFVLEEVEVRRRPVSRMSSAISATISVTIVS